MKKVEGGESVVRSPAGRRWGRVSTLAIMRAGPDPREHIDTHKVVRDKQHTRYAHTSVASS
jgi:hypothetical protein